VMTGVMVKARSAWNWVLAGFGILSAVAGVGIVGVLVIASLGAAWEIYERNSKPSINDGDLAQLKGVYERISPRTSIPTSTGLTLTVVCAENGSSRIAYTIGSDGNLIELTPGRGLVPGLCWDNRIQLLSVQDRLRETAQGAGDKPLTGRNPLHGPR
jgi:hypothetical protein